MAGFRLTVPVVYLSPPVSSLAYLVITNIAGSTLLKAFVHSGIPLLKSLSLYKGKPVQSLLSPASINGFTELGTKAENPPPPSIMSKGRTCDICSAIFMAIFLSVYFSFPETIPEDISPSPYIALNSMGIGIVIQFPPPLRKQILLRLTYSGRS